MEVWWPTGLLGSWCSALYRYHTQGGHWGRGDRGQGHLAQAGTTTRCLPSRDFAQQDPIIYDFPKIIVLSFVWMFVILFFVAVSKRAVRLWASLPNHGKQANQTRSLQEWDRNFRCGSVCVFVYVWKFHGKSEAFPVVLSDQAMSMLIHLGDIRKTKQPFSHFSLFPSLGHFPLNFRIGSAFHPLWFRILPRKLCALNFSTCCLPVPQTRDQ